MPSTELFPSLLHKLLLLWYLKHHCEWHYTLLTKLINQNKQQKSGNLLKDLVFTVFQIHLVKNLIVFAVSIASFVSVCIPIATILFSCYEFWCCFYCRTQVLSLEFIPTLSKFLCKNPKLPITLLLSNSSFLAILASLLQRHTVFQQMTWNYLNGSSLSLFWVLCSFYVFLYLATVGSSNFNSKFISL